MLCDSVGNSSKNKRNESKIESFTSQIFVACFWMLLETNNQSFTENTKMVAEKPQKVGITGVKDQICQSNTEKSRILVLTIHKPSTTKQRSTGSKRVQICDWWSIYIQIAKFSQPFSEKEKTQHEIVWGCDPTWARTWSLSDGVERDSSVAKQWRCESWLQHILKETQQLLNWNCKATSTHSRWSCWLICGEFEIIAPTGVSKDLIGTV